MSNDELLSIDSLSVEFLSAEGRVAAVRDVSLSVREGEIVGLVGESGSGKSVTSLAVMGLVPSPPGFVSAQSIRLAGRELIGLSSRKMAEIRGVDVAMIFQEPMSSLNPAFKVGNQIAESYRKHRGVSRSAAKRRAVEMLERVGIPNPGRRVDQYPHEFSGGMLQRAMIAMALTCEPKLLIADEPTTALDVTVQAQILDLLREVQADTGMSILFITHDLGVVADLCDRVKVLYAGEIVEEASVFDTFADPQHPYTKGLLASMPQQMEPGKLQSAIPGSAPHLASLPSGCPFHPRCPVRLDRCSDAPIPLYDLGGGRASRCVHVEASAVAIRAAGHDSASERTDA